MDSLLVTLLMLASVGGPDGQPFWATANRNGLMPESSGALLWVQARKPYDTDRTLQWRAALSLAARSEAADPFSCLVDEAYAGIRWKALSVEAGLLHRAPDFVAEPGLGSLSATSGNVIWSGNARSMPGYTLSLDPVAIPYLGGRVLLEGSFGDYRTTDTRQVQGALVHNTRFRFIFKLSQRLEFRMGLDHFAFWGGTSRDPEVGVFPVSFKNYLRMLLGRSALTGSLQDQFYVLGNQLGGECFRFDWRGEGWRMAFQHDIPYEDGSGMGFQNFPDGVNTLWFGWDDKRRWVSDLLYEYHHTTWQSGPVHDAMMGGEYVIFGGRDNYFNHAEYRSGWTSFGRVIGDPLMLPEAPVPLGAEGSMIPGIRSNRFRAHHFAMAGALFRVAPYKLMLTWSNHYGTYDAPLREDGSPLGAFSGAFMGEIPLPLKQGTRMRLTYGLYGDAGPLTGNRLGASIGLRYIFY